MGWHEAYLVQARSEHAMLRRLELPPVEYCHRLHYLQMVSEKLAKAMLTPPASTSPAPTSHAAFVRMLRTLKTRPDIRRRLGYRDTTSFGRYINSLLELAERIEGLAPDQGGLTKPNPEYPWEDLGTGQIRAPAEYRFPEFNPRDPKMIKIDRLIADLLLIAT